METNKKANRALTKNAQELRQRMTDAEKKLWYDFLRKLPVTVNRQKVIGKYIVDFYIASADLVIEVDGSQHYDNKEADAERDRVLNDLGLEVKRYWNKDIFERFRYVCEEIYSYIEKKIDVNAVTSSGSRCSPPSPRGEGKTTPSGNDKA